MGLRWSPTMAQRQVSEEPNSSHIRRIHRRAFERTALTTALVI
jgi:hypothetical protein